MCDIVLWTVIIFLFKAQTTAAAANCELNRWCIWVWCQGELLQTGQWTHTIHKKQAGGAVDGYYIIIIYNAAKVQVYSEGELSFLRHQNSYAEVVKAFDL